MRLIESRAFDLEVPNVVTIRLARHGGKKKPFYHVTVAERAAKRDGRFIERVGFYNPVAKGREEELRIDLERVDYWLSTGAQPTDRVKQLVAAWRKSLAQQALAESTETEPAGEVEPAAETEAAAEAEPVAETAVEAVPVGDDEPSAATEASTEVEN